MPTLVVIGPQIKEKQMEHNPPSAYILPNYPSLNMDKMITYGLFSGKEIHLTQDMGCPQAQQQANLQQRLAGIL